MSNQIAQTILSQLGGSRFVAMTGAKNLVSDVDSLQFKLPRGAKRKINFVKITLEEDLYKMEFMNFRDLNVTPVCAEYGVYAAALPVTFTTNTGLDTRL